MNTRVATVAAIAALTPGLSRAQLPASCLETLFASNGGGAVGGAVLFDLTATQSVRIAGIETSAGNAAGAPVGLEVYTVPGTYQGSETNAAAWTLVAADDGSALSAGFDNPTVITFAAPFTLVPGTCGIALVGNNSATGVTMSHRYTNGNGANQSAASADAVLSAALGAATNTPFAGTTFVPRVWNGRMCHGAVAPPPLGATTADCQVLPHSQGGPAHVALFGTGAAGSDILGTVSNGPASELGYFISGTSAGVLPAGCGLVCIGGPQYRYQSQLFRFDAAGDSQALAGGGAVVLPGDGSFGPVPAIAVGETRRFQGWFRDAGCAAAGQAYNFSDVVAATFH